MPLYLNPDGEAAGGYAPLFAEKLCFSGSSKESIVRLSRRRRIKVANRRSKASPQIDGQSPNC
jgi:hypothetical protein